MSSMFMLRDHGKAKKGEVASFPFVEAKKLIADGIAVYVANAPKEKPPEPEQAKQLEQFKPAPSQQHQSSKHSKNREVIS